MFGYVDFQGTKKWVGCGNSQLASKDSQRLDTWTFAWWTSRKPCTESDCLKKKGWFRAFHSHLVGLHTCFCVFFYRLYSSCFQTMDQPQCLKLVEKTPQDVRVASKNGSSRGGFHMLRRCDRRSLTSLIKNDSTLADRSFYLGSLL